MTDRVRAMKGDMSLMEALTIAAACGRGDAQRYSSDQMKRAAERLVQANVSSREDIVEELLRRGIPV